MHKEQNTLFPIPKIRVLSSKEASPKRKRTSLFRSVLMLGAAALTPLAFAQSASAQSVQREIINPSFEDGPTPNGVRIGPDSEHPGWRSTDGTMETWRAGFQSRSAQQGTFLVELNPRNPVGLYQEICLINGESLSWDFYHAARTSSGAPTNQTVVYEVVSQDGATTHQRLTSNRVTELGNNDNQSRNAWDNVAGTTTYAGPSGTQRLQFRSTNAGGQGNFLDNISVALVPLISFSPTNTSDFETGSGPYPSIAIVGNLLEPATVTISTTGTATLGTDYTLTSNTITIPAGSYDGVSAGSLFEVPIVVNDDGIYDPDETVIFSIDSISTTSPQNTPVQITELSACSNSVLPQSTHTILDVADPAMTLTKVADDATDRKPGDTVTYTYTVVNTGNVNIDDVTVSDVHNGTGALSLITIDALTNTSGNSSDDAADNDVDVLAPNDSVTFEATYVVTEADVTAGGDITNTATVTGDPAAGALPATPITADEAVSVAPLDVDLSLTKTNTPGVNGEVDQAADTLTSGDTTTYTVVITNNGPDSVTGAVVTDTVGAGLTCAVTNPVTITGDGVPAGSFTIGDLTGAGITLDTLADGEAASLTYTCEVN